MMGALEAPLLSIYLSLSLSLSIYIYIHTYTYREIEREREPSFPSSPRPLVETLSLGGGWARDIPDQKNDIFNHPPHPISQPLSFLTKGCCINNIVLNKIDGRLIGWGELFEMSFFWSGIPSILFRTMLFIQQPFVKKLAGLADWMGWMVWDVIFLIWYTINFIQNNVVYTTAFC